MNVQPTQGHPVPSLPGSVAVVLHRVNTEGLQLPQVCRQSLDSSSRCSISSSHGAAGSRECATDKGSVCGRGRVRSPPSRLIAESARVSKRLATAHGSGVTSNDRRRVAVNGYKVKHSLISTEATTRQKNRRKCSNTSGQCGKDDRRTDVVSPMLTRSDKTTTSATGSAGVSSSLPQACSSVTASSKSLSRCISPPTTAEQSRTNQQAAGVNKTRKGVKTKTVVSNKRRRVAGKVSRRRKRVVSVEFLDSSDVSDVECVVKTRQGEARKRGRGSSGGQGAKLTPRKRRRLSSSADEHHPLTETPLQPPVPPDKQLAPPIVPTSSSELEGVVMGVEEMCTSDDDFAVSKRLEELQRRQTMTDAALIDRISEKEEEIQLPCVPPDNALDLCSSSVVADTERDGEQCQGGTLRDACSGNIDMIDGTCIHYDDLEIDSSAIIGSGECVANIHCVPGVLGTEEKSDCRTGKLQYSILRSLGAGKRSKKWRLQFGTSEGRKPSPSVSKRSCRATVQLGLQKDEEPTKTAEDGGDREQTEPAKVPRRGRGRPKSRKNDMDNGQPNSVEGAVKGRRRPKAKEDGRGRGRPKSSQGAAKGSGRPQLTEGTGRGRGRPKSTEGAAKGSGRPKSTEGAAKGSGRPKSTEGAGKGRERPNTTEGGKSRGRPKSVEGGNVSDRGRLKSPEGSRGRPKSVECGRARTKLKSAGDDTATSLTRGHKPVKEMSGRRKKENNMEGKNSRAKPSSSPSQGSSTSPLPPLASPEDSGYSGSICSSSSQGQKAPLKSPEDISPMYALGGGTNTQTCSVSLLQEHRRGTVNTAELGMFSPELAEYTTTITNIPMPLDPPQWEWSAMGMGGANSGELYPVNCTIDQDSEVTQNLFDPSKMIIAKVESLSEDSRFNEYLNEILESEEVMECLNSINTESLAAPSQLQSAAQEPSIPGLQSETVHVHVPAISTALDNGQTEACVATLSTVVTTTSPTTVAVSESSVALTSASDAGLVQPSAETVAAYVAAETNLPPVSVTTSLKPTPISVNSDPPTDPSSTHVSITQSGQHLKSTTTLPLSLSLAPGNCVELKSAGNVMWSPTELAADTCLKTHVCDPPSQQQPQSQSVPPESESKDSILKQLLKQPPSTAPTTAAAPSSTEPVKPRQEKRRIIRVKRRLKGGKMQSASETKCTNTRVAEKGTVDKGKSCPNTDVAAVGTGSEAPKVEVKSRNGRLIKPSWKLSQTTHPAPKCVTSPSAVLATPCTGSVDHMTSENTVQLKTCNTARSKVNLSMAAVVGPSTKILPDIPEIPCSPNPTVSLPSSSATLSMSLDDILRQMNDDEPQEEKIKFAESLLADVPPADSTKEEREGGKKGEEVAEEVSGDAEKREGRTERKCVGVVKQASDKPTSYALSAENTITGANSLTFAPCISPRPLVANEQVTGNNLPLSITQPSSPLTTGSGSGPGESSDTQPPSHHRTLNCDDEEGSAVDMSLCDSDTTEEELQTSPAFKRQLSVNVKGALHDYRDEREEDEIEIFADDIDTFTVYTMEEKPKKSTPPRMPSPPRNTSPVPYRGKVSHWVQDQRAIQFESNNGNPTHPRRGRLRKGDNFCSITPPLCPRPLPFFPSTANLPTHPPSAPPTLSSLPRFPLSDHTPTPPPINSDGGHHRPGHGSMSTLPYHPYGTRSGQLKPCRNFLRGCCTYKRCRFSHAPLDSFPDDQLENSLQCLSVEMISPEIARRYVVKSHSHHSSWFPLLIQFIRGLLNKNWDAVFGAYKKLSVEGVVLTPTLLSRFLELCREQVQPLLNAFVQLPDIARELLQKIRATQGSCSIENYRAMLRILEGAKKPVELMDVYQSMKGDGHLASLEILHLVTRGTLYTDDRILQLLNDSKSCLSATNDIARIANTILEKVSPQLLARKRETVSTWVSEANGVLDKIGQDAVLKLFNLFVSSQSWPGLLSLLEQSPRTIASLGVHLCQPLSMMVVQQPALSDRATVILEMMADDTLNEFSAEGWNTVLTHHTLPGTSQRATKFCRVLSCSTKCLDQEALNALLEMVVAHRQPTASMAVLQTHLQFVPPVIPSMVVLSSLSELLLQSTLYQDLYGLVDKLLRCRVAPSLPILQSFVNSCSEEKAYSRLATVVKKAKECGIHLEKTFYQLALVLLRRWGQDQVSLSIIYKSLRTIDTETAAGPLLANSTTMGGLSSALPLRELHGDSGRSTPGSLVSRTSSRPCSSKSYKSRRSLEGIFEKSNEPSSTKPGIITLLESNGKQGQYGAMVSILRNLQDSSRGDYSAGVVQAVWRAITESDQKPANAFSSLLEQLKLAQPPSESGHFIPCDHWLAAQLGIALLKKYTDSKQWQSGFIILHHLHLYNISYIIPDHKPFAPLSPLKPPLRTPCGLARIAVTTCLKSDNVEFAVSVLERCEWMRSCSPGEKQERVQLLVTVAERCLQTALHKECCRCLQELNGLLMTSKHFAPVTKLYNRLFADILSMGSVDMDLCMSIYENMNCSNFPCVPKNFSLLLEKLCDLLQFSTAGDLCKQAMDQNFYPPMTYGDMFAVHLPPSIHHIEVSSLLERHLHKMGQDLEEQLLQPLTINFNKGTKNHLEQALVERIAPSLPPDYTNSDQSSSGSATISPANLLNWFNTHYPNSHFCVEGEGSGSVATDSDGADPTARTDEKAVVEPSNPTVTSGLSMLDASATDSDCSAQAQANLPLNVGQLKQQRRQFREVLCRSIVSELKPFYQAEKFNSYEDYLHLVKVLTTHVCKLTKSRSGAGGKWGVNRTQVRELVNRVMSQCTKYSPESDVEFE